MHHSNSGQPAKKYNQKTITAEYLKSLQADILDFCEKHPAHHDARSDVHPLLTLKNTAEQLNLSSTNLLAELYSILHAVQHFIKDMAASKSRLSTSTLSDWLQLQCEKIEECDMTEITAIHCALDNLKEHAEYSGELVAQRKKWGFAHASELNKYPHLFNYLLSMARQIQEDIAYSDTHLTRSKQNILRYIGGLMTGCEVMQIDFLPTEPAAAESLNHLPLHFGQAFLLHENKLYFYNKQLKKITEIYISDHDIDHIDHILAATSKAQPLTPSMLKAIRDLSLFSGTVANLSPEEFKQGIQYFSPRNILVALIDGVFTYFEARTSGVQFQDEMIDVLSIILEKGLYENLITEIADYIDDQSYAMIQPSKASLDSLMKIGYASTKEELQALRSKCCPVMDARGIELSKADVEAIIYHTPGRPDSPVPTRAGQTQSLGITCPSKTNTDQTQSEKTVEGRSNLKNSQDDSLLCEGTCNTAGMVLRLNNGDFPQQTPSETPANSLTDEEPAKEEPKTKPNKHAPIDDPYITAQERWKPWQRVLFGIGIGILVSAIFVGIAAALFYAGPLAHIVLATGITAAVHWAAAVGVAGVVGTLAGIPVVGAIAGFVAGLFWNRKTEREMKTYHAQYQPQDQLPVVSKKDSNKVGCCGFLSRRKPRNNCPPERLGSDKENSIGAVF